MLPVPSTIHAFNQPTTTHNSMLSPHLVELKSQQIMARKSGDGVDIFQHEDSEESFHLYGFAGDELKKAASELSAIEDVHDKEIRFIFVARCEDKSLARVRDLCGNPAARSAVESHLHNCEVQWVLPAPSEPPRSRLIIDGCTSAFLILAITTAAYLLIA